MSDKARLAAATDRMILRRAFGAGLRELRRTARVMPWRLHQKCRVALGTIKEAELGRGGEPGLTLILAICNAVNVTTDDLRGALPSTRGVRPQLEALIADGAVWRRRAHGNAVWGLTPPGRKQFARARRVSQPRRPLTDRPSPHGSDVQ